MNSNIFTASECEVSASKFNYFYDNEFSKFRADYEDRLDQFWLDKVHIYKFEKLSFVVKLVLALSHGQASVEREFSVNNTVNNYKSLRLVRPDRPPYYPFPRCFYCYLS